MSLTGGIMGRKKITSRQKEIILIIAKNPIDVPITISDIANKLQVSTRTVLREMSSIEKWLDENDFELVKKPGVGLILNETLEEKQFLLELINEENVEKEYTKEERKLFILSSLLSDGESIKTHYFTKSLNISEATLNNDINELSKWLESSNIRLIKKPGIGIYLEGEEDGFRSVQVKLIYEFYNDKEIMNMIKNIGSNIKTKSVIEITSENRLLNLIDKSIIKSVESILTKTIESLNMNLSDSSYIGLVVHISLAIQRIRNGEKILINKDILNELRKIEQFEVAVKIAENMAKEFSIDIPIDEVGYITMHLRGSKLRIIGERKSFDLNDIELINLSKKVINLAQEVFKIPLEKDERLLQDLTNHLGPSICRMNMKMDIRNPLLENIQKDYSDVYYKMEDITKPVKDVIVLDKLPESELGYIAMHFASALERNLMNYTNINAVISCPTGIGTSRFLLTDIKKRFPNLNLIETISALNIDENYLNNKDIDLIISTVELDTNFRHICVNTIMTYEDESLIKSTILNIAKEKSIRQENNEDKKAKVENKSNNEKIFELMNISKSIIDLLEEFKVINNTSFKDIKELINFSSKIYAQTYTQSYEIKKSLQRRIDISSPYIDEIDMCLLHCSTESVSSIKMAIIKNDDDIWISDEESSKNIIFMLIPEKAKEYERKILSEISQNIIDNEELINSIKSSKEDEIKQKITNIVTSFYENQINLYTKNN